MGHSSWPITYCSPSRWCSPWRSQATKVHSTFMYLKALKFATEPIQHYPPHLRHVATLPWEIKNLNFLQIFSRCGKMQTNCILIASNFASRSPYWLQLKFFSSLLFYLFIFAINLRHRKFVTADVTALSVNNEHGIKRHGQDFDKTFI